MHIHNPLNIEFDLNKDATNVAKHGVSLALGALMDMETAVIDRDVRRDYGRDYGEERFNALGMIDGRLHAMSFTVRNAVRIITLRKANPREMKRFTAQIMDRP